jgi:hypothetical protein
MVPWLAAALAWPSACAAGETLAAAQALAPPADDRAALILYRPASSASPARGWRMWFMRLDTRGLGGAATVVLMHEDAPVPRDPRQQLLLPGQALRIDLLPGTVALSVARDRLQRRRSIQQAHTETLDLQPGSLTVIEADALDEEPVFRFRDPAALQAAGTLRWAYLNLARDQHTAILAMHAGAQAIEPPVDPRCLPGPRTVRWANAALSTELIDCAWQQGTVSWSDGSRLETRFRAEAGVLASLHLSTTSDNQRLAALCAMSGSPLSQGGGALFFAPCGYVSAVDGIRIDSNTTQADLLAWLRGAPNSIVRLSVVDINGRPLTEREVQRVRLPQVLALVPEGTARFDAADGSRFTGRALLLDADAQAQLPYARPADSIGQLVRADGSGYVGEFRAGLPNGRGWCFDVFGGESCHYESGLELVDTGALRRPADVILAEQAGLPAGIAVDFLRRRHLEALLAEDWNSFLQLDADLMTLGADTGVEALYFTASALEALGRPEPAITRLTAYLNLAGSSGVQYGEALSMFARLQPRTESAREARLVEEDAARDARRAFCASALAEGVRPCGCAEFPELGVAAGRCR